MSGIGSIFARYWGGPLKRLHPPTASEFGCMSIKARVRLSIIEGIDLGYLKAGLMKPRRGLTLVADKETPGMDQL